MRPIGHFAQLTLALLLAACGGGGGSDSTGSTVVNTVPPQISVQPANQSVTVSQTATFAVTATGTAPLQYQWNRSGTAIGGAHECVLHHARDHQHRHWSEFHRDGKQHRRRSDQSAAVLTVTMKHPVGGRGCRDLQV